MCGEISKLHGELKNCNQSLRVCETKMEQQDVRIEKLECQVKAQDQKINILQTEKQNLLDRVNALQTKVDNPNTHTDCKATMQKAFASALQSTLPETNESVMDFSFAETSVTLPPEPMSYIEVTSTLQPGPQPIRPVQLI